MRVNTSIFREYDIRGIVDKDLTQDLAYHLGRALGTLMRRKELTSVTVGRDCRPSGAWLAQGLKAGYLASGITVLDIGVVPTPLQYYSMHYFNTQGGVQITGSHNPPEYNGFKISMGQGTMHGDDIRNLATLIQQERYDDAQGVWCSVDTVRPYMLENLENLRLGPKKLKVVVDAGNGTAGPFGPELYRRLGCEVIELYCDMDARFPNHHPDPTVEENMIDLQKAVKKHKADLGIAFDGDGDRIGVVDEKGQIIWGDRLMILLAREVLKDRPGAAIVGEVKCSQTLYDDITKHGGQAIMWKAGHSLIKAKMKETKAELAGEMSGHIFFKHKYYGFDDALYTGGRLLEILSNTKLPLSKLFTDVPTTFATPELRVDCEEEEKFALVKRAQEHFRKKHKTVDVDGVRILFDDGWGLIRASNTQPILVLRFEAQSEKRLKEIRSYVERELASLRESVAVA
ncbi:MAG: phosphomannomutase/phosphoglucomutase [Deltaproteobacteria bacterium]|nr:phosphomannomutase/phosphoglucomutase [Deltaproteobacteria bacterium]